MPFGPIVCLVFSFPFGQAEAGEEPLSPAEVWGLIRQAAAGVEDVSFKWEYRADLTGRDLGDVPAAFERIVGGGQVRYSYPGLIRVRFTLWYTAAARAGSRTITTVEREWSWDGSRILEKQFYPWPGAPVGRVIRVERKPDPQLITYLGHAVLTGFSLPLLHMCLSGAEKEPGRFAFRGWQEVEGRECLVFSFFWDTERSLEDRYYVDLARGGHPVRTEVIRKGKRIAVTRVLEWCPVRFGAGGAWYVPQDAECLELYCRKRLGPGRYVDLYTDEGNPFSRSRWHLLCGTVKVNGGLQRQDLVVDLSDVARVHDLTLASVKLAASGRGRAPRDDWEESPVHVQVDPERLRRLLDEQARSLEVLRSDAARMWWARHWASMVLLIVGALAIALGVGALWFMRRTG